MRLLRFGRFLGWLMLVLSIMAAVAWWGWLLPVLRGTVQIWGAQYSQQEFWNAKQVALKSGVWMHDDGWIVGVFGDKEWAARIIQKIKEGSPYFGCENGHQEGTLALLTNHSTGIASGSGKLREEQLWLEWWSENANKTQVEWIRDGFTEAGISISAAPDKKDWPVLLRILGACAGPSTMPSGRLTHLYEDHLRHNAYRWLRDSGFTVARFVLENGNKPLDGDIRGGLLEYEEREAILHLAPFPGRLPFADRSRERDFSYSRLDSVSLEKISRTIPSTWDYVGAAICGLALIASPLLLFLRRRFGA